ncbi:MAG: glutamate-5-semialdehyde dehydrogenase, partial [Candidatus Omnitrophica bacterium]|nr:glutamate-5-semialdehyde dehydrogenase [Candidatus Omnitrophota bacterium]MBD3268728.1 glutamate-5-semialdehyde dehydrogenase [Candidatus Omnitrophota bacterium]
MVKVSQYVKNLVGEAREASYELAKVETATKNKILRDMARELLKEKDFILKENSKDLAAAEKKNLKGSFIDRLRLDNKRIKEMSLSLKAVAALPDPVGKIVTSLKRPNGIRIKKVRAPIGVILIIYEARPNVTSDCTGLLFKTSNVGILRGGGAALHSNTAIGTVLKKVIKKSGLKFNPFFIVGKTDHRTVDELLKQDNYIDMVIPRGGEVLIRKVVELSRIPVIKHYKGICNIYIDRNFDIKKALDICVNAKVQRPSVCNAVENILIHKDSLKTFLPLLKKEFNKLGVEIRGDEAAVKTVEGIRKAKERDWQTEYLDLIVAVKTVKNAAEAVKFINKYGSHHTDAIITNDSCEAKRFVKEIDSACCFINISTRFSDGYQFGLGAEIGISTDKLHARGPMGLEELTTYK